MNPGDCSTFTKYYLFGSLYQSFGTVIHSFIYNYLTFLLSDHGAALLQSLSAI